MEGLGGLDLYAADESLEGEIIEPQTDAEVALLEATQGRPPEEHPDLNPFHLSKQELQYCFARSFGWPKSKAADFAGYVGGSSQGVKLEQRAGIAQEIARLTGEHLARREPIAAPTSPSAVLARGWDMATVNYVDAFVLENGRPTLKRVQDMPPGLQRSIKRFIFAANGDLKDIELHDPVKALEKISGFLGLRMNAGTGPLDGRGGNLPIQGDGDETSEPVQSAEGRVTTSLTFEERLAANGDRVRTKVLKQSS